MRDTASSSSVRARYAGGRVVGLSGSLLCLVLASCQLADEPESSVYLDAAVEVAAWLSAQARHDQIIPDQAFSDTTATSSLGAGASGRILFFLELFQATKDPRYLARAEAEADVVLLQVAGRAEDNEAALGLYNGVAGGIVALTALQRLVPAERFEDALSRLTPMLMRPSVSSINDVIVGAAGRGLTLLEVADSGQRAEVLSVATVIGDTLIGRAKSEGIGLYWLRAEDMEFNLPNFSHGTAGVGFFFARLHEATGRPEYLEVARSAADYLVQIADHDDGLFLVPYGVPNEGFSTNYDIGWAHGPAGTARLFYQLWKITGEERYLDQVEANARTLVAAGVPIASSDTLRWAGPFRIDQRFGTSGAVTFLLGLNRVRPKAAYEQLARAILDDIIARSTLHDDSRYWSLPRYGFQGNRGEEASYTGYFYGAAGLGLSLLHMHYAHIGQSAVIAFPDDPFRH